MDYEAARGDCFAEIVPTDTESCSCAGACCRAPESIASGLVVNEPDAVLDDAAASSASRGTQYSPPVRPGRLHDDLLRGSADGWWEIHTVLQDPSDGDRCFGTMYLMVASAGRRRVRLCVLPRLLRRLPDTPLDASWRRTARRATPTPSRASVRPGCRPSSSVPVRVWGRR